jgi:type I restriction enzyme S subunit
MTSWPTRAIQSFAKAIRSTKQHASANTLVWNLNLDQIEPHGGRVLEKVFVSADKLGPSTFAFEPRTVLYSKLRPYLNKVVVADEAGFGTTELVPLRCDPDEVHPEYLAYFLRSEDFLRFATEAVAGAKMPRMVMGEFWNFQVPIPPIAEQRRIAAILEHADSLRAKRREALVQLNNLTQSIFVEMFGQGDYPTSSLADVCELITDGTHQTPVYAAEGVIFLSAKNVTSGYIDWEKIKYIPESLHHELHRRISPRKNDILLAKNGTTGVAAIVDRDCTFDIYVSLALLRPKEGIVPAYLLGAINSPICKKQFNESLKGIGVPNLHLKEIRATHIPLPPMSLQNKFLSRIAAVEKLKVSQRRSLSAMDALLLTLQHRAFRGEL